MIEAIVQYIDEHNRYTLCDYIKEYSIKSIKPPLPIFFRLASEVHFGHAIDIDFNDAKLPLRVRVNNGTTWINTSYLTVFAYGDNINFDTLIFGETHDR